MSLTSRHEADESERSADATASRSEIVALAEPLRRIVASYAFDRGVVDDVVQETLTRVLDARARVSSDSALSYAVVTAHNLMRSDDRRKATAERNASRVLDMSSPGAT